MRLLKLLSNYLTREAKKVFGAFTNDLMESSGNIAGTNPV